MLERFGSLARAIARDPELTVVEGPVGAGWRFHAGERRIEIEPADLSTLPEEALLGLICHEAAHATLTRYPFIVPKRWLADLRVAVVLNALEDIRIESWLLKHNPGTRPWLQRCNDRLFPVGGQLIGQPAVLQYALGAIHHWWHGELPNDLDSAVVDALRTTQDARGAVERCHPGPGSYPGTPLEALFRRLEGECRVPRFEQQVRTASARAWQITWDRILPVVFTLGELHDDKAAQAFLDRTAVPMDAPPRIGARLAPIELEARQRVQQPRWVGWTALRQEMLPGIRRLTRELEAILLPDRAPRWNRTGSSGQRVDLRALMQREARPETVSIWRRKSVPRKRDAAFLVLVDLSGSMRGERVQSALRGVVLIAETLERMGIRFAVHGFQDLLIPLKGFDADLRQAEHALLQLSQEVAGVRDGGHNRPAHNHDGPVLIEAVEELEAQQSPTPVLVVVSDGEPSGPSDAAATLERAVREVGRRVHLIGLGLGPGTEHVARFYPRHAAELPLEDFPEVLASHVAEALR